MNKRGSATKKGADGDHALAGGGEDMNEMLSVSASVGIPVAYIQGHYVPHNSDALGSTYPRSKHLFIFLSSSCL